MWVEGVGGRGEGWRAVSVVHQRPIVQPYMFLRPPPALPPRQLPPYRTLLLFFGHDFKTAEPLLHMQSVDGGVEFAIKIVA